MSHFLCISCEILARPLYLCAAKSPHVIDIHLNKRGLHDEPGKLRNSLQESIDSFDSSNYEAILLGYGLCGNSTIGLQARSIPLVIPRVHDCISLLLGSSEKYLNQFNQFPGTYWYSQDLLERSDTSGKYSSLGADSNNDQAAQFKTFVEKYGEDNAIYLMETIKESQSHYNRAVFIDTGLIDPKERIDLLEKDASTRGWKFEKITGELLILKQLLAGEWKREPGDKFLILSPGETIAAAFDGCIFQ